MWNHLLGAFIGDLPSSFNYIVKEAKDFHHLSVFKHHSGHTKHNKSTLVSIFIYEKKNGLYEYASRALKKAKTVKHPNFVIVHEALEVPSAIYIVTEPVTCLQELLEHKIHHEFVLGSLPWNAYCLANAIAFLHTEAKSFHGCISPQSVVVTNGGQWKLNLMELCHSSDEFDHSADKKSIHSLLNFTVQSFLTYINGHPTRVLSDLHSREFYLPLAKCRGNSQPLVIDRIAYAALLALAIRCCGDHVQPSQLSSWSFDSCRHSIPPRLESVLEKMYGTNAPSDVFDWTKMIQQLSFFQESELVSLMSFLENIALKGNWDKERFFQTTLPEALASDTIPMIVNRRLILPNSTTITSLQPLLLRIFLNIVSAIDNDEEFHQQFVWGTLEHLFKSTERSTRYALLQTLQSYQTFMTEGDAFEIFEPVLTGLTDSLSELRDITLRALFLLLPKIIGRHQSLVERTVRLISRLLQRDENEQIRTNAAICFAKLVPIFNEEIKAKEIAPNFIFGLKDSFAPCRLSSLQGIAAVSPCLTPSDIALKYLPAICTKLLDPDPECRDLAFRTSEYLIDTLKITTSGEHQAKNKVITPKVISATSEISVPAKALMMLKNVTFGSSFGKMTVSGSQGQPPPQNDRQPAESKLNKLTTPNVVYRRPPLDEPPSLDEDRDAYDSPRSEFSKSADDSHNSNEPAITWRQTEIERPIGFNVRREASALSSSTPNTTDGAIRSSHGAESGMSSFGSGGGGKGMTDNIISSKKSSLLEVFGEENGTGSVADIFGGLSSSPAPVKKSLASARLAKRAVAKK